MFALSSVLSLALAADVLAGPLATRQTGPPCIGLGEFGTDTKFTFSAAQVGGDGTLIPLIFTWAGEDALSDALFHLSTNQGQDNYFDSVSLTNGILEASLFSETSVATNTSAGDAIIFGSGPGIFPAAVYCGQSGTDPDGHNGPNPILTIGFEDADSIFSICTQTDQTTTGSQGSDLVAFMPSEEGAEIYHYDLSSCYDVTLQMVQA